MDVNSAERNIMIQNMRDYSFNDSKIKHIFYRNMINSNKSQVLILISNFLPGYKIGGPLTSILNLTQNLNKEIDFFILTSNCDFGDSKPYVGVEIKKWINFEHYKVMYLSTSLSFYWNLIKILFFACSIIFINN